jgi:hypothetical protein
MRSACCIVSVWSRLALTRMGRRRPRWGGRVVWSLINDLIDDSIRIGASVEQAPIRTR